MEACNAQVESQRVAGSFRDPSGFVFRREGKLYRQINQAGYESYRRLIESGLAEELTGAGLLIPHEELGAEVGITDDAALVILPREVPFLSYPYEWCHGQLKAAALATLDILRRAIAHGMILKDASAFNIQFIGAAPVLIDTLSFAPYTEGQPWIAYRQFCQHFLAPLLLMSSRDPRLSDLLRAHLDGIPLDLASKLLPARSWFSPGVLLHIHLHARSLRKYANTPLRGRSISVSRRALLGLADSLEALIQRLEIDLSGTEWGDYEETHGYSVEARLEKERIVRAWLSDLPPSEYPIWDLGANVGAFSRIAAELGHYVVAFDIDPVAVEKNFRNVHESRNSRVLPLRLDLTNPSPALGWGNEERFSHSQRAPAHVILALALVHHLAIGANVPLDRIASYFAELSENLIIEFVPKSDPQVQRLLGSREDIFDSYSERHFEEAFDVYFETVARARVTGTDRTLYRFCRRR